MNTTINEIFKNSTIRTMDTKLAGDKSYNVTLIDNHNHKKIIKVKGDEYLSDAAMNYGLNLPTSCNAGVCVTCTAKVLEGSVIHDHDFLAPNEEKAGFILTCRTFVTSDCTILTHQEDALLNF